MYSSKISKALFIVGALSAVSSLQAAATTYSTRAAFDTAAGATTMIDFNAQQVNGYGYTEYGSSLTVGDVTFTDNAPRLFVLEDSVYGTSNGSAYLNNNSVGTVVGANFANPVYAVGMDLGYLYSWGGGTTAKVTLSTGDFFTLSLPQLYGGGSLSFWGVTSTTSISSITFDDYSGGLAIDNFSYSANGVADSGSTALMMFGGLLALVGLRSKRE